MESLGVGTTSPHLPSLLRDQTQLGLFSREGEEEGNIFWSPWASGQLPHPSPPICLTRLNQGYSLVRRKKQGTKFGVSGRRDNFPTPSFPTADQTQPGLFYREKKKQGTKFGVPWVGTTSPRLPSLLHDQTQPGLFSREMEEAGNIFWSPWASGQFPHLSPPYCVNRFNKGYSLVRKKKQEESLESLGVGTTSPPLSSLLRDQTH